MRVLQRRDARGARVGAVSVAPDFRLVKEAMNRIVLGDNVRLARLRRKLTQAQLAKMARTTQARICSLEQGEHDARLATLVRIKESLRCSWSNLLRGV